MPAAKKTGISFPSVLDRAYQEHKRHLRVDEIMSRDVVTTTPGTLMSDAARIMGERHIGSLIVMDYGTPVAIVTERDLLSKVLADGHNPETTTVEEVMSFPLIRICPATEIREAARTMIHRKGRLAVFECGRIVGVIAASDLIREMPDAPETSLNVDEFMTKDVVTVDAKETIDTVAGIMGSKRIGSVIVTREGKPPGIFTERDLLSKFLMKGKSLNTPVGKAVSSPLKTAPAGTSIHDAAKTMAAQRVRRLPLMKKNRIAGIITARDLVEAYAK
ncbi:MAG: Inosine-5'-monophosphate dehydrogenase [Methanoregula sp. PtaU1.Bin051]|nr:MAG: Inosine-5'-monophosphate dehydrogenase [Methanoregula sp. PtaU1.Bin051]